MKKYFIYLGVLVAVAFVAPQISFAAITGSGTEIDPYIVTTCEDLQDIPSDVSEEDFYKLDGVEGAIDCSMTNPADESFDGGGTWADSQGFAPIYNFRGNFNGNNNTIDGLYINRDSDEVGLFRSFGDQAYIHDFDLTNVDITGNNNTGGLVGIVGDVSFTIDNVLVSGEVSGDYNVGGLMGNLYASTPNSEITISNIDMTVDVSGGAGTSRIGGLFGYIDVYNGPVVTVSEVSGSGELYGEYNVGGIVGNISAYGNSTVYFLNVVTEYSDTYTSGYSKGGAIGGVYLDDGGSVEISSGDFTFNVPSGTVSDVGGVIGELEMYSSSSLVLSDADTYGSIDASTNNIGGFIGSMYSEGSSVTINNGSSSLWSINDGNYNVGGAIGLSDMYYSSSILIDDVLIGGEGVEMYADEYYVGGVVGYGYSEQSSTLTVSNTSVDLDFTGSPSDEIGGMVGELYLYTNSDVDISDSSVSMNLAEDDYYNAGGLLGYVYSETSSDISISGTTVSGTLASTNDYIGGFVGYYDANNGNMTISNSSVDMDITGRYDVGGMIGDVGASTYQVNVTITDSTTAGTVSGYGEDIGGFIGNLYGDYNFTGTLTIENSTSSSDVWTDEYAYVGGLVGNSYGYAIDFSGAHSSGNINGDQYTGGLIGYISLYEGTSLSILDSSAGGSGVDLDGEYNSGGLIGYLEAYDNVEISIENTTAEFDFMNFGNIDNVGGFIGYLYIDPATVSIIGGEAIFNLYDPEDSEVTADVYNLGGLIGYVDIYDESNLSVDGTATNGIFASTNATQGGLFGYVYADYTNTISISDVTTEVDIRYGNYCIGGMIGEVYPNTGLSLTITGSGSLGDIGDSESLSNISGGSVGGFVGCYDNGSDGVFIIEESYAEGDISSNNGYLGGLVGYMESGDVVLTVSNSYTTGDINSEGSGYIGGVLGEIDGEANLTNVYATGTITGTGEYTGGLVGYLEAGSVTNSFSAGLVSGGEVSYIAGLVGYYDADTTLTNNYYDIYLSDQANCSIYNDGGPVVNNTIGECEGVNAENVNSSYFLNNSANSPLDQWDFTDIWVTVSSDYPTFIYLAPVPEVETGEATDITQTTATIHGDAIEITGEYDYTEYGVVYALADDNEELGDESNDDSYYIETSIEEGEFTVNLSDLECSTEYDYKVFLGTEGPRLYAENAESFTTSACDEEGPAMYTLTTSTLGNGEGSIIKDPLQPVYEDGTEVTVTAVADAGSTFSKWSNCSTSTSTVIQVTMSSNKTCVAKFNNAGGGSSGGGSSSSSSKKNTPIVVPSVLSCSMYGSSTLVKQGSQGIGVSGVQQAINQMSAVAPKLSVDGSAGSRTRAGIMAAQNILHIAIDGIWGQNTQAQYISWTQTSCTGATPIATVTTVPAGLLKLGMQGADVKNLQELLIAKQTGGAANALKSAGATGTFGPLTQSAVIEFQKANGLSPDGVAGSQTLTLLKK